MKTCPNCGTQINDNIKFCGNCGTPLENIAADDLEKTVAAGDIYNTAPTEVTETPAVATAVPVAETQTKTKKPGKKMKKGLCITLLVSFIVIAVTLVVGFLTDWFGLTAPVPRIVKAAAKTFNADSFTVKITEKISYAYDGETETDTYKSELKVVTNGEKLTMLVDYDDGKGIYKDGTFYSYSDNWAEIEERDIDKDFFKIREKISNGKEIDYEGIIKEYDLDEYIKADEAESFVKKAIKKFFTNKKWMKNTMGYKKDGKTMTFSPDFAKMYEDFADFIDDSDIIKNEDNKDAVVDILYEEAEYYEDDDMDMDVDISVTLKRGYLESIEIKVTYDNGDYELLKFEFYDINKTEIEDKDIRRIKNKTNKIIEENSCIECGNWTYDDYELDGEKYCCDCYYNISDDYGYCNWCYELSELYLYEGYSDNYYLCYDCYYN